MDKGENEGGYVVPETLTNYTVRKPGKFYDAVEGFGFFIRKVGLWIVRMAWVSETVYPKQAILQKVKVANELDEK